MGAGMIRLVKLVFLLGAIGFAGLAGYAYLGDIAPEPAPVAREIEIEIE